jgi:hypothetical protein
LSKRKAGSSVTGSMSVDMIQFATLRRRIDAAVRLDHGLSEPIS